MRTNQNIEVSLLSNNSYINDSCNVLFLPNEKSKLSMKKNNSRQDLVSRNEMRWFKGSRNRCLSKNIISII